MRILAAVFASLLAQSAYADTITGNLGGQGDITFNPPAPGSMSGHLYGNGDFYVAGVTPFTITSPTNGQCLVYSTSLTSWINSACGAGGGGTVTTVSVVSANGLSGTVATSTTTPAIILAPTFSGVAFSTGSGFQAAATTGSGSVVLGTSPTLVSPALGTPTALVLTNATALSLSALANLGTTTTVLHGNAAGNPSFGALNLATEVTGTLSLASLVTCSATDVLFASSSTVAACNSGLTFVSATGALTLSPNSASGGIICAGSCENATNQPLIPFLAASRGDSEVLMWGIGTAVASSTTCKFAGCMTDTGEGDLVYESTFSEPTWGLMMTDNTANNFGQMFVFQNVTNTGQQINFGIDTFATGNCRVPDEATAISPAPLANSACAFIWLGEGGATGTTVTPFVIAQQVSPSIPLSVNLFDAEGGNNVFLGIGATTAVKWIQASSTGTNQATVTLGDTHSSSTSIIQAASTSLTLAGSTLTLVGSFVLPVSTVAALPTCNSGLSHSFRAVSDATLPTYNGTLTGGGAVIVPVFCNGSAWLAH